MTAPFVHRSGGIALTLGAAEVAVLRSLPDLLVGADDTGRLDYVAHPDDSEAEVRYRELIGDDLTSLRRQDATRFLAVLGGDPVEPEGLEGFMRVVGEARLVLAARLGIEDDGWDEGLDSEPDPELVLLGWLGYLQDAAVGILSGSM